jgi:mannose-6-phosphate isomerase-like protein (cupin superfamily)
LPVFRQGEPPPAWCELEAFAIVDSPPGAVSHERRRGMRERVLVTRGSAQLQTPAGSQVLRDGQFVDLQGFDAWQTTAGARGAEIVRLSGHWGTELGGCGIFSAANDPNWKNAGDAVTYAKFTSIDSHYHDCDEFWIILEGAGTVVVGDRHLKVVAGDCVPIGMGHHHDLPVVTSPIRAVYFETTLTGEKRVGHLWNHTHGPARPMPGRI